MYPETQRGGVGLLISRYYGDEFQAEHKKEFDQNYMRRLHRYAYENAEKGYPWQHASPGFAGKAH